MNINQLRWLFSLAALATLAIFGLQMYIWNQGIEQERVRFSRAIHHAVYEATEAFMRPVENTITVIHDTLRYETLNTEPGLITLRLGQADSNITLDLNPLVSDSTAQRIFIFETSSVANLGPDEDPLSRDRTIERIDVIKAESLDWQVRDIAGDTALHTFIAGHPAHCPSCQNSFSGLTVEDFKTLFERELDRLDIQERFDWGVRHMDNWLIVEGDTSALKATAWKFPFLSFRIERTDASPMSPIAGEFENATDRFYLPTLYLHFPLENWHLFHRMRGTLFTSTFLALMILTCIGYAVRVILHQKQLSEIKTDFINNMTHEFKTPISTISLACEAMQDADISLSPTMRRHYTQMIASENDRLATQVEKVLQMALLDKKELDLNVEPVHIHQLLRELVEAFLIQVHHRKGTITTALHAPHDTVKGDAVHLRHMFINLLDNANKYSPSSPEIIVETRSADAGIEIAVHDKGIGINRDALRKIFDRFYRVPTGNVHDVKGFGLGLSYVHTMALAHGGHIRATSKPGVGSSFYLFLPVAHA